jgi:hypothetical protein
MSLLLRERADERTLPRLLLCLIRRHVGIVVGLLVVQLQTFEHLAAPAKSCRALQWGSPRDRAHCRRGRSMNANCPTTPLFVPQCRGSILFHE